MVVVVASVVCEAKQADSRSSELPGPGSDIGLGPGKAFREPGNMLDRPDLLSFGDNRLAGTTPMPGDMLHPPISVYLVTSGPGPPELGITSRDPAVYRHGRALFGPRRRSLEHLCRRPVEYGMS